MPCRRRRCAGEAIVVVIRRRVVARVGRARATREMDAPTYYYIDPQGREQGPFAYEHVAKWFKAGYLKPNLGCRRSDETTYARTVTAALLEDGPMHGVPAHMLGELVKPTVATAGRGSGRAGGCAASAADRAGDAEHVEV